MAINPIPDGFHTITPYMAVKNAAEFIDFLSKGLNAVVLDVMKGNDGAVMHANVKIGDSMVMVAEAPPERALVASMLYLYVPDTDVLYHRVVAAGGISLMEPADQFYGDRNAGVQDRWGNQWWIATHVKDVTSEEMQQGMNERERNRA